LVYDASKIDWILQALNDHARREEGCQVAQMSVVQTSHDPQSMRLIWINPAIGAFASPPQ
jgi:hypothetical protein